MKTEASFNFGHIAEIRPDKVLLAEVDCLCIGSKETKNGNRFSDNRVLFYPDEVCIAGKGKEKMFLVPVIPISVNNPKRVPVPIFMLNLSEEQKKEIVYYGKKKSWKIRERYFCKQQIAGSPSFYDPELTFDEDDLFVED